MNRSSPLVVVVAHELTQQEDKKYQQTQIAIRCQIDGHCTLKAPLNMDSLYIVSHTIGTYKSTDLFVLFFARSLALAISLCVLVVCNVLGLLFEAKLINDSERDTSV